MSMHLLSKSFGGVKEKKVFPIPLNEAIMN